MYSTPRGTRDILPLEWPYWNFVTRRASESASLYGYDRIETPTFAETGLFARTSGEGSDVVDKEMYTFQDRAGEDLTLRAEGTAPIMRAYLQHGMSRQPQPVKLYYLERIYRYDRPQKGRLREHHQFGCEAIGSDDAYVDVEMIGLLHRFYASLGLCELSLHVNTIGDRTCRPNYVADLVGYLKDHQAQLGPRDLERIERNPLRVLDSKEHESQSVLRGAPRLIDYLCGECLDHWDKVLRGLDLLGLKYQIDPYLVRGLDYYTRTVFEFLPEGQEGAQSTVGGGGRYDALSEALGGPAVPGVGFGTGLERIILNLQEREIGAPEMPVPAAFVVQAGAGTEDAALKVLEQLHQAGVAAQMAFGGKSLKAQMRQANGSGARYALIVGEAELAEGKVVVRELASGEQWAVGLEDAARAAGATPPAPALPRD
ncbi:MAG: histidine--tRNA ligase [Chloroflexota bacterium]